MTKKEDEYKKTLYSAFCRYHNIPDYEWEHIQNLFEIQTFKRGENIIIEGQMTDFFGFIVKGLVRLYYQAANGNEFNQEFRKEGDFIMSYHSIIGGQPALATYQALEKTTMLIAKFDRAEPIIDNSITLQKVGRAMAEETLLEVSKREKSLLIHDAQTRYDIFLQEHSDFIDRLSQKQIALYVRVDPATLNRMIKNKK